MYMLSILKTRSTSVLEYIVFLLSTLKTWRISVLVEYIKNLED